ncbi:MAG: hypothetical protein K6F50_02950 [Kiritimatiellae bacterium]|nr:hypothetical protein [Kiritimatiellia bacterium]
MLRRAFTLIELLVIISIIVVVVSGAVVSFRAGLETSRLRGALRDVFATIRQARSRALVTQKAVVLAFTTSKNAAGEMVSGMKMVSAELRASESLMDSTPKAPRSLDGYKTVGSAKAPPPRDSRQAFVVSNRDGESSSPQGGEGGQTLAEALFEPLSEEVLKGICIKTVFPGDEEVETANVDEAKRSSVSTFSNIPYLLSVYRKEAESRKESGAGSPDGATGSSGGSPADAEESAEIMWQTNGRPHSAFDVYVYLEDDDWREGRIVKVDPFGSVKVDDGEDE